MLASVEEVQPGTWTIYIADQTQNWYFQSNFSYSGPGASAEWVEEAPNDNGQQTSPANFGTVSFSETGVYGNFGSGPGWYTTDMTAANEVDMMNSSAQILAAPSAPTTPASGGQSFSDTYILPPDPPSGLTANASASNVELTWQAPTFSGGLPTQTYIVGQQQPDGSYSPVGTVSSTSTTLSGSTPGATYTFAVAAENTGGWVSSYSLPATVTVPAAPPPTTSPPTTAPPSPPTGTSCVTISGASHVYGVHGIAWVNHVRGNYGPWNVAIATHVGANDSVVIATSEWGRYPPGHGLYVSAASPIPMPASGSGMARVYAGVHGTAPFTSTPAVDITWTGC